MTILEGVGQSTQIAQTCWRPKLAAAFEPPLPLAARRFDRPRTHRPTPSRDGLIVHPPGVSGKVVLLPPDHLATWSATGFQRRHLPQRLTLPSMPQLMQFLLHPRPRALPTARHCLAQIPQMLAGMIEIQQLHRPAPTVLHQIPNPRRAVADA